MLAVVILIFTSQNKLVLFVYYLLNPVFHPVLLFCSGGNGNYILSTSYLGSLPSGGLVPPMCKDGYGVFYATMPNR